MACAITCTTTITLLPPAFLRYRVDQTKQNQIQQNKEENKIKQNKTKQNKTKQNKTKQNKINKICERKNGSSPRKKKDITKRQTTQIHTSTSK
jgi:mannitol-specific phosphotransferase system IIBC component